MSTDLIIHLDLGPDRDDHELERANANLRNELRKLDEVKSVEKLRLGEVPVGAKVADPTSVGSILMTLGASHGVIVSLIGVLAAWLHHDAKRSLTIHVGKTTFEMKGGSAKERQELADKMLKELHDGRG